MDQYDEILKNSQRTELSKEQDKQLSEVLYSMSELTIISVTVGEALIIHDVVEMILNNKYNDKMRM